MGGGGGVGLFRWLSCHLLTFKDLQRFLPSVEQIPDISASDSDLISIMTFDFGHCFDLKQKNKKVCPKKTLYHYCTSVAV